MKRWLIFACLATIAFSLSAQDIVPIPELKSSREDVLTFLQSPRSQWTSALRTGPISASMEQTDYEFRFDQHNKLYQMVAEHHYGDRKAALEAFCRTMEAYKPDIFRSNGESGKIVDYDRKHLNEVFETNTEREEFYVIEEPEGWVLRVIRTDMEIMRMDGAGRETHIVTDFTNE